MQTPIAAAAQPASRSFYLLTHVFGVTLVLAVLAIEANTSGLDMALAQALFDFQAGEFPLHHSRLLDVLGHQMVLAIPISLTGIALAGALASYRVASLRAWRSVLWAIVLTGVLGQIAIGQIKHYTALPRPYNLALFGGYAAYPLQWWAQTRAFAGEALPSAHTGAGYALLALYFAGWAMNRPALRWGGLATGLGVGLLFSAVRIMQGAHFLSQTLWSAVALWLIASLLFYPMITRPAHHNPGRNTPPGRRRHAADASRTISMGRH